MARIGTKQNAAKEAPIVNRLKTPDFGSLNVDRYVAPLLFANIPAPITGREELVR